MSRGGRAYRDPEVLELFAAEPELLAVADALAATGRRPQRGRATAAVALVAVALAAVAALALPSRDDGRGVVDEALAAVGTLPVVHAVVSSELADDERVDLDTGRTRPVAVTVETWFDDETGRLRTLVRHESARVADVAAPVAARAVPGLTDVGTRLFATEYRAALYSGDARVVRRGDFAGRAAIWLEVRYGDRTDEVVIDAHSHEPIAFRGTAGDRGPTWTIDLVESVPRREHDFAAAGAVESAEGGEVVATRPVSLERARGEAGFVPVWPGRTFGRFTFESARVETVSRASDPEARARGLVLGYRGPADVLLEIAEATTAEPAYGFTRGRFTFNLNPIGADVVDVARVDGRWIGQLRRGPVYVRISSVERDPVVAAARALRSLS